MGALPWLVLLAATVGLRANRRRPILLILIPLIVVNLLYLWGMKVLGMTSSDIVQFDVLFHSLTLGLTLLWLVAPVLNGRGFIRVGIAFGLVMALAGLCVFSYGAASSGEAFVFLVVLSALAAVLVLAPVVSRALCKGLYRPGRFMLWLGLWTVVGGVLAILGTFVILLAVFLSGPGASEILVTTLMAGLLGAAIGLCVYMVCLPYMILGFVSPFFRQRLLACLNLTRPDDDASA